MVDCGGAAHVLQTVLMAYLNQASSLQGSHGISCDILAVDDLGTVEAGNRASKTRRYLQWWENKSEQNAVSLCVVELT